MSRSHRIEELILDVSFTSSSIARREKKLLANWMEYDLLPALDQLFDRYAGEKILRFEKLEFDFGRIESSRYQKVIVENIVSQLESIIKNRVLSVSSESSKLLHDGIGDSDDNSLTQLIIFLRTGQLPWFDNSSAADEFSNKHNTLIKNSSADAHQRLLSSILERKNIASILRSIPERDLLVERLLSQFLHQQIQQLLRQLNPGNYDFLIALNTFLMRALDGIKFGSHTQQEMDRFYWKNALHLFLQESGQINSIENWGKKILESLADYFQQSLVGLLTFFNAASALQSNASYAHKHVAIYVDNLYQELQQHSAGKKIALPAYVKESSSAEMLLQETNFSVDAQLGSSVISEGQILYLLERAFINGEVGSFYKVWPALQHQYRALAFQWIMTYLNQPSVRQSVAFSFSMSILNELFGFVQPQLMPVFILSCERFSRHLPDDVLAGSESAFLHRELWLLATNIVFNNPSHAFTKNDFLIRMAKDFYRQYHFDDLQLNALLSVISEYFPDKDIDQNIAINVDHDNNEISRDKNSDALLLPSQEGERFFSDQQYTLWQLDSSFANFLIQYHIHEPNAVISSALYKLWVLLLNGKPALPHGADFDVLANVNSISLANALYILSSHSAENLIKVFFAIKSLRPSIFSIALSESEWLVLLKYYIDVSPDTSAVIKTDLTALIIDFSENLNERIAYKFSPESRYKAEKLLKPSSLGYKKPGKSSELYLNIFKALLQESIPNLASLAHYLHDKYEDFSKFLLLNAGKYQDKIIKDAAYNKLSSLLSNDPINAVTVNNTSKVDSGLLAKNNSAVTDKSNSMLQALVAESKAKDLPDDYLQPLVLPQENLSIDTQKYALTLDDFSPLLTNSNVVENITSTQYNELLSLDDLNEARSQEIEIINALKSGAISVSSLDVSAEKMEALVITLITSDAHYPSEYRNDFLDSVVVAGKKASHKLQFYTEVLTRLLQQKTVDLEFISSGFQDLSVIDTTPMATSTDNAIKLSTAEKNVQSLGSISEIVHQPFTTIDPKPSLLSKTFPSLTNQYIQPGLLADPLNNENKKIYEDAKLQLEEIVRLLKSGSINIVSLNFTATKMEELIAVWCKDSAVFANDHNADFIKVIFTAGRRSSKKVIFYSEVLKKLLHQQPVDLDELSSQVDSQSIVELDHSSPTLISSLQSASSLSSEAPINSHAFADKKSEEYYEHWQLIDLIRSLKSGSIPVSAIDFSERNMEMLLTTLIETDAVYPADYQADFINAIFSAAKKSSKKLPFYKEVLDKLINKATLDLESLLVELESRPLLLSKENTLVAVDLHSSVIAVPHSTDIKPIFSVLNNNVNNTDVIHQFITSKRNNIPTSKTIELKNVTLEDRIKLVELLKNKIILVHEIVLGVTDLARLVEIYIESSEQVSKDYQQYLLDAVHMQAKAASNKINFYQQILLALINEKEIDVEEFSRSSDALTDKNSIPVLHENQNIDIESQEGRNLAAEFVNSKQANIAFKDILSAPELSAYQFAMIKTLVERIIAFNDKSFIQEWLNSSISPLQIERLVDYLPSYILHRLLLLAYPQQYSALTPVIKIVMDALALMVANVYEPVITRAKWLFIFEYLFVQSSATDKIVTELAGRLAVVAGVQDVSSFLAVLQHRQDLIATMKATQQNIVDQGSATQHGQMRSFNNKNDDKLIQHEKTCDELLLPALQEGIHIANAGQILAAPYIPRLFSMLNLTENGKFLGMAESDRAAHLLQFMVTGMAFAPEYELLLNKVLCGISTSLPMSAGIAITEHEQNVIEQMLNSMIQHWKVLGSTSIAGLRQTFLQRQGWLSLEEDGWRLRVQQGPFDMLLDQLPWNISIVKHGWMNQPLRVSWRE